MKIDGKIILSLALSVCLSASSMAQRGNKPYNAGMIHSHNDYSKSSPYTGAYTARAGSIEADIALVGDELYVTHDPANTNAQRTLKKLYLDPIVSNYRENGNKAYPDRDYNYALVLDIKSGGVNAINKVIALIADNLDVFDTSANPNAIKLIFTGGRPAPAAWGSFPKYIWFDYSSPDLSTLSEEQKSRIGMISLQASSYLKWSSVAPMTPLEYATVKGVIGRTGKIPLRFWEAPDVKLTWWTLANLGVAFINSDQVANAAEYMDNYNQMRYPAIDIATTYDKQAGEQPLRLLRPYSETISERWKLDGQIQSAPSFDPASITSGKHSVEYTVKTDSELTVVRTHFQIQ